MVNKRKGVTLAEMCIVIAVVAIISLSVVSFAAIARGRGAAGAAKLDAMEEIERVESLVDQWFALAATKESAAADGRKISIENGADGSSKALFGSTAQVSLKEYVLTVAFPETEGHSTYRFEKVERLFFDYAVSGDGEDVLCFCTVTYFLQNKAELQTYTFCINPRVGEEITPGAAT